IDAHAGVWCDFAAYHQLSCEATMESTTPANSAMNAYRPHRRRFLGAATMTVAAAQLAVVSPAYPALGKLDPEYSLGAMKQIDAGVLNVGYADLGPKEGPPVILLHGWPYDVHSFVVVAPLLASEGYRVLVPYLRGY